jgi:hypothetical protein
MEMFAKNGVDWIVALTSRKISVTGYELLLTSFSTNEKKPPQLCVFGYLDKLSWLFLPCKWNRARFNQLLSFKMLVFLAAVF